MTDALQKALTAVELREAELLSWGAVGAEWRHSELVDVLGAYGNGQAVLDELLDIAAIVRTAAGGFRSRSAETVRLLATLRQAFRSESILSGRPLVLDYRFLQRPRRRPRRDIPGIGLAKNVAPLLGSAGQAAIRVLTPPTVSAFQERSTKHVLEALRARDPSGVVVTAGTL